ncbi:hypothetical protein N7519_004051 [Penicillium mononematosum]|uniref:uncharacterized protein n=1 Tax=Penicillium mononematosum TaxID=268346 RepID=UPI002549B8CC|nr:uncharacterized protein N7519_004051 [Penicillium mononematosum]KAJ6189143.1 hypothetical protein N7519_004051 [Penicillium mononematosum]
MPRPVGSCPQHGGHRDRPDKLELYVQICKPHDTVVHWMIAMKYPDADRCTRLHSIGYMGNRTLSIEHDKRFDSDQVETTHYLGRIRVSESTTVEMEAEKVPLQSCQLWACYLILRLERKGLLKEDVRKIMDREMMIHALFMGMQVMDTQTMDTQIMTTQAMTTQAMSIQAIGIDVIDTQVMVTQIMGTQIMATKAMTTQAMSIQVIGIDVIGTQVMATQIMITQLTATKGMGWAYRSRIMATQTMTTQIMGTLVMGTQVMAADTDIRYQYHSFSSSDLAHWL